MIYVPPPEFQQNEEKATRNIERVDEKRPESLAGMLQTNPDTVREIILRKLEWYYDLCAAARVSTKRGEKEKGKRCG